MKEQIDKLDFINIKNFCYSKDTVRRIKGQTKNWEKSLQTMYLIKDCIQNILRTPKIQ